MFTLEERYIVLKLADMSSEQESFLRRCLDSANIPTRESVVIERHWPIYGDACKLIRDFATKDQSPVVVTNTVDTE